MASSLAGRAAIAHGRVHATAAAISAAVRVVSVAAQTAAVTTHQSSVSATADISGGATRVVSARRAYRPRTRRLCFLIAVTSSDFFIVDRP